MVCQVYRNNKGNITRVTDPSGKPSKLYLDLFQSTGNKEEALRLWAHYYVGMKEGMYREDMNGEPYVEQLSDLSFATEDATDDAIRVATTNLPQRLVDLDNKSNNYQTTNESEVYTNKISGKQYARVTGLEGPINKARINPRNADNNTYAENEADRLWGSVVGTQKLTTELGQIDKATYIERLTEKLKATAARGTLIHKYIQLRMTNSPAKKTQLQAEINKLHQESGIAPGFFRWVKKQDNYQKILKKAGLNIYDDIDEDKKDKILSELTVASEVLGWAGTIDMLVQHYDGTMSITDFKTGWRFNKSTSSKMFKYGAQKNISIFETPRESAKLQLMTYALMLKAENPDISFRKLAITWIPSKNKIGLHDHRATVEVEDYLGLIRDYLRNEEPSKYEALQQSMITRFGERDGKIKFNELFNPEAYEHGYEYNTKRVLGDRAKKVAVEEKLEQLRIATLYDIPDVRGDDYKNVAKATVKNVFTDLLELMNDLDFKPDQVRDISFLSLWLSNNSDSNSGYIQLYGKFLAERKQRANARYMEMYGKFRSLVDPIKKDYEQAYGKSLTENIPFLRGAFNMYNQQKMWNWLYSPVLDEDGNVIEHRIRSTEAEWAQARAEYPELGNWDARINLANFLNDTYSSFFVGQDAIANKKATVRKVFVDGEFQYKTISSLDLHNESRKDRNRAEFKYEKGWFPKVAPLIEEYGNILNKKYREEVWKRATTLKIENEYDDMFNETEALPIKYTGSKYTNSTGNYSINAEVQFDKFARNMIYKDELDDVYAFGVGLMEYLNKKKDLQHQPLFENTVKYLETAIEMQVRGRKQLNFPGGFVQRNGSIIRNGQGNIYKFDWIKMLRSAKTAASAPIMWLKVPQGTANGIFTYMFTLKESIKDSLIKSGQIGNWMGIDGDQTSFTFKDYMWATRQYWSMQADAMQGNLRNNKIFLMTKHLGYLPDNYDWGTDLSKLATTRNHIFSQSTMYMFHSLPEEAVAIITMLAQLRHMKAGEKSLWDRYNVVTKKDENGEDYSIIEWDGHTRGKIEQPDGTYTDLKELSSNEIRRMYYIYQKMHGGYRQDERTKLEYYVFGELFMQFKRFMPNLLRTALKSKSKVHSYGYYKKLKTEDGVDVVEWHSRVMEGRWRVLAGLILNTVGIKMRFQNPDSKFKQYWNNIVGFEPNENYKWKNLDEGQREVLVDFAVTMFMSGMLVAGYVALFADAPDDDPFAKYWARIGHNFSQQWNFYEVARDMISNNGWPASGRQAWGFIDGASSVSLSLMNLAIGDQEAAFTQDGDLKGWATLRRHIRFISSYNDLAKLFDQDPDYNPRIRR